MVYDITDSLSFDKLDKWQKILLDNAPDDLCVCIVGNKCDLEYKREVQKD